MPASDPSAAPRKPWSTTDKALLASIVVMTGLLVAGVIAVIAWLIWGEGRSETSTVASASTLRMSGPLANIALDGTRLAVHGGAAGHEEIVIYDLRTGMEERRVRIERDDVPPVPTEND